MPGLDTTSVGDTVEFTIKAEVVAKYESGRLKLRWHSGEDTIYPSDSRLGSQII